MTTPSKPESRTGKHTPVKIDERGYLVNSRNRTLADFRYVEAGEEVKELIVRAVNSHTELLEALKAIQTLAAYQTPNGFANKIGALAGEAIALAEGRNA